MAFGRPVYVPSMKNGDGPEVVKCVFPIRSPIVFAWWCLHTFFHVLIVKVSLFEMDNRE